MGALVGRYTEWVGFRCTQDTKSAQITSEANWGDVHARELYAVQQSCRAGAAAYSCEVQNLAQDPAHAGEVAKLSAVLRAQFRIRPKSQLD